MTAQNNEMFDQVRDILKKLDRSIDDARERRLATDGEPSTDVASKEGFGSARPGRARPLRRDGDGTSFSTSASFG